MRQQITISDRGEEQFDENRSRIKNSEHDKFQEQILDGFNLVFLTQIIYQSPGRVSFRGVFSDMTDYASSLRWEVRHYTGKY